MSVQFEVNPWSRAGRLTRLFALSFCALSSLACGPEGQGSDIVHLGPIDRASFAVSDFFTPSGHMGDGQEPGHIVMSVNEECRTPFPPNARGKCYRFVYGPPGDALWAGVFWAFPANNWGSEPGRLFRPWVFEAEAQVIRQRYNRVRFWAAARRDTFEVSVRTLVDVGGTNVCYSLRNAVLNISGNTSVTIDSEATLAESPAPTMFTPCPEAKARVVLPPGNYTIELQPGFSVEVDGTAAAAAQPVENPRPFSLSSKVTTQLSFDLNVDGQVVALPMGTPLLPVAFFAGGINDAALQDIRCPGEGKSCRYTDNVLTGAPKSISVSLRRELQPFTIPSSVLRFQPPCVTNAQDEAPVLDDVNSTVACPSGTWTTDGLVATCPLGLIGAMQADGKIACCDGGNPLRQADGSVSCGTNDFRDPETGEFVSVPRPVFTGVWKHVEDIEGTLLGAFGWSTSYADFETEPASGELSLSRSAVPLTYIYVDDIVWDYALQPE